MSSADDTHAARESPPDRGPAGPVPPDAVPADRIRARAAGLRPSERRAGSDDPEAQAEAILTDAEERRRAAACERDPDAPVD